MEAILNRLSSNDPFFTHLNLSKVDVDDEQLQLILDKLSSNNYINRVSWREGSFCNNNLKKQIEDKIELNNQHLQLHPTDFTHGLLSIHVYANSKVGNRVQLQKCEKTWNEELRGWKVIKVFNPDNDSRYYGAAYLNEKKKRVVLAHRGTTLTFLDFLKVDSPLKNDLDGILNGKIVSHQKHAFVATKEVIEYAQNKDCSVSFTGHSLGAWLAELSLYHAVYDFEYFKSKAVTFDSPGAAQTMDSFQSNVRSPATKRDIENLNITSYLSAPNLVNVCNPHIGNVFRIYPKITWANITDKIGKKMEKIPIAKHLKPFLYGLLSVVGHSIVPMVATFNSTTGKPVKFKKVLDWPCIKFTPTPPNTTIGKGVHIVFQFIPGLRYLADEVLLNPTYWTVLEVLDQWGKGNFERQQFFEVYKYLETNAKEGYPLNQTNLLCSEKQFHLLYKAHYRVEILNLSEDVYNKSNSSDWYLHKLRQIETGQIDNMGIDANLKEALKSLKSKYQIKTKFSNGKKYISAESSDIQVDNLRGEIMKLCATYPAVIKILENRNAYSPQDKNQSVMIISNLPNLSVHIVERPDVRKKIEEVFKKHKVVVISGFAGFGKSTMAKIYGRYLRDNFSNQVVRLIDADSSSKINDEYKQIAENDLKIPITNQTAPKIRHLVHYQIEKSGLSVLFILDNVDKFEDVKIYLDELSNLKSCKVIITCRSSHLSKDLMSIGLDPFTKEEATSYAENSLGRRFSSDDIATLIDKLSKDNFVWPHGLSHAVAYLDKQTKCSMKDYMEILEKSDDETNKEICTYLLFDVLNKSKLSWCVLQYSAYLDPDFISTDIFKTLFSADEVGLQVVINKLENLSLISSRPSRNGHCGFQIHRLVQDLVKKYVGANIYGENKIDERYIFEGIIQALNSLFPSVTSNSIEHFRMSRIFYPHAVKIFQSTIHCNEQVEMAELYDKLGNYTRMTCDFAQALKYHKKSLEIKVAFRREQNTPLLNRLVPEFPKLPISPDIADSLDSIGFDYCCMNANNATEELQYFYAAYMMRQALYPGENHPDIARSLLNIGRSYGRKGSLWKSGNNIKALEYNKKALEMLQALYSGQNHASIVNALLEVGTSYRHENDKEKSLKYYIDALKMAQALYPEQNHSVTTECLRFVGGAYSENGDASTGVKYVENALKMAQALNPGENLPTVCGYLRQLGLCYLEKGDKVKAIKNAEAALKMVLALFNGNPHADVANTFCVLGFAYLKQGYIEKSVEYLKQSYLIDSRIIDGVMAQHPELTKPAKRRLGCSNMKFLKNKETREIISQRGSFDESVVQIMKKLHKTVLVQIHRASLKGKWSSGYFFGQPSIFGDWGVSSYLNEPYLRQQLGSLSDSETKETARMLCFEAICLGIMRSNSKSRNVKCAKEFLKAYPKTIEKIINDHPEYCIDGSILRQCTSDQWRTGSMSETRSLHKSKAMTFLFFFFLFIFASSILNVGPLFLHLEQLGATFEPIWGHFLSLFGGP